jgi:4-amino-4-deoxy-L-arabinose transferase-like glycosyltransferase
LNTLGLLVLLLIVATPIAWFASEFQDKRWLRLALGTLAILLSFGVAGLVGWLERFNSNAWFGNATKELIDAAVTELEAGNRARVLRSLKDLQGRYAPTYENRARYDTLVQEAVKKMRSPEGNAP